MRIVDPPRFAVWLLRNFDPSPNNESLIGDLNERLRQGRSRIWYWRQVGIALVIAAQTKLVRKDRVLMRQVLTWTIVLAAVFSLGVWTGKRLWINVETLSPAEMQAPQNARLGAEQFRTVDFLQMELDKARLNSIRDRSKASQQLIEHLQLKLQAAQTAAVRGEGR
jgi:hypothetical protein